MTVKELINLLQNFPQDAKCTYDYGLDLDVKYQEEEHQVDFH